MEAIFVIQICVLSLQVPCYCPLSDNPDGVGGVAGFLSTGSLSSSVINDEKLTWSAAMRLFDLRFINDSIP